MKIKRKLRRAKALRRLRDNISKDKGDSSRLSKWLKLMECKKKLFSLEDDIDRITKQLQRKKDKKGDSALF